jgi:hypothetical protein
MSSSFADQLLKAGLVSENDINKAEEDKKQRAAQRKAGKANKGKRPTSKRPAPKKSTNPVSGEVANAEVSKVIGASKASAEKAQVKKAQQAFAENRRIMNMKINELLKDQPVEEPADESQGDTPVKFSYVYDGKVRGIYVSDTQQKRLAAGELAVTVIKAKTILIPVALAEPLLAIDPKRFIHIVKEEKADADDPYAGFKVPDDLTW